MGIEYLSLMHRQFTDGGPEFISPLLCKIHFRISKHVAPYN